MVVVILLLSLATSCTIAHQTPVSMGFSRQEYWSGLPFPSPGDLPDSRIKPASPSLADGFFTTELLGKPFGGYFLALIFRLLIAFHAFSC